MAQDIFKYIQTLDDIWFLIISGLFSFLENLIPPLPSDVIVGFCAFLSKNQGLSYLSALILINIFMSSLGFMTLYFLGHKLQEKIYTLKWFKKDQIEKTHLWFNKYGYLLITVNRFFPGIRSVIGLYAGMANLEIKKVLFFSLISSTLWTSALIYIGHNLSKNKEMLIQTLSNFSISSAILMGLICVIIIFLIKRFYENKNHKF